jgi:predicted transcriptional regulator
VAKPDIRERFGDAVRLRREELALTQEDLAGQASIHRTYLSDIERGSRNVSLINIEKLASALRPRSPNSSSRSSSRHAIASAKPSDMIVAGSANDVREGQRASGESCQRLFAAPSAVRVNEDS